MTLGDPWEIFELAGDRKCWDCGAVYVKQQRRFLWWTFDVQSAEHDPGCRVGAYERGEYNAIGG